MAGIIFLFLFAYMTTNIICVLKRGPDLVEDAGEHLKAVKISADPAELAELVARVKEKQLILSQLKHEFNITNASLAAVHNVQQPLLMGDMELTYTQLEKFDHELDKQITFFKQSGRGRMAAPDFQQVPSYRWTKMPIPYLTTNITSENLRRIIDAAMNQITERSGGCISFKKVYDIPIDSHIFFQDEPAYLKGSTCATSPKGKRYHGNTIRVSPTCEEEGAIVHETLHSLGFGHTQSRLDRDKYLKVHWENIQDDSKNNFEIWPQALNETGTKYDYTSVMHYASNAFAIDHTKDTMTPLENPDAIKKIMGRARVLSDQDVTTLKKIYCSKITTEGKPCIDRITSCDSIKTSACKLTQKQNSTIHSRMLYACSLTCQVCDNWKLENEFICKDVDAAKCFLMSENGDCQSSNMHQRMVANLMCPGACGVCIEKGSDATQCTDEITTCADIAPAACRLQKDEDYSLFMNLLTFCSKTCKHLCGAYTLTGSGGSPCGNYKSECFEMHKWGNCTSANLAVRTEAHLMCSEECNVCKGATGKEEDKNNNGKQPISPPASNGKQPISPPASNGKHPIGSSGNDGKHPANPNCTDKITACGDIKSVACHLTQNSPLFPKLVKYCSSTCDQLCGRYSLSDSGAPSCTNYHNAECRRMAIRGDCKSTDLVVRMDAYLKCPKSCKICTEKDDSAAKCTDKIKTCADIAPAACRLMDDSPLFTKLVEYCPKTCDDICGAYTLTGSGKSTCDDDIKYDCYQASKKGKCTSADLTVRTEAHLRCPNKCNVCTTPKPADPTCIDHIRTCKTIEDYTCSMSHDDDLFSQVVSFCSSTCGLCGRYEIQPPECGNFDTRCFEKGSLNDCHSTNKSAQAFMHLTCPQGCDVCVGG